MKRSKKGFTLIELLIVIAIIAILAAIAIPTFAAQLGKANDAVDAANLRAATSLAVADYMLAGENTPIIYTAVTGGTDGMAIERVDVSGENPEGTSITKVADSAVGIYVSVADGGIATAAWATIGE